MSIDQDRLVHGEIDSIQCRETISRHRTRSCFIVLKTKTASSVIDFHADKAASYAKSEKEVKASPIPLSVDTYTLLHLCLLNEPGLGYS